MTPLSAFLRYYFRSALPFLSGLGFGIALFRFEFPLWAEVAAGMVLVVVGPFVMQVMLTLLVEALRGIPEEPQPRRAPVRSRRTSSGDSGWRSSRRTR